MQQQQQQMMMSLEHTPKEHRRQTQVQGLPTKMWVKMSLLPSPLMDQLLAVMVR